MNFGPQTKKVIARILVGISSPNLSSVSWRKSISHVVLGYSFWSRLLRISKWTLHSDLRRRAASRRALPCPSSFFLYQQLFARNFRLQFWVGLRTPNFGGRGGCRGSGMIPFERALVIFYRPSIVTFPISLRVSEILQLLFSIQHVTFSLPHL